MLELGIDVSLATDGGACANTEDMLAAMKFVVPIQKSEAQDPRVFNARDILRLATLGGATALGLPSDLGAIEVGRLADFFLFDPYRLKSVPMHEPLSTLVYAGEQTNVDTVVVDGQVVLEGGKFATVDEEAFVREVHDRALALSQRIGTFRLVEGRRFTPFGYDGVRSATPARATSEEPPSATSPLEADATDGGGIASGATGSTVPTTRATPDRP